MTRGAAVAAVVMVVTTACSGSGGSTAPTARGGGDCALVVHWGGRIYETDLYAVKSQNVDPATVATPAVGRSLEKGVEEGCGEGSSTTSAAPIEVFAIPGVDPADAVTTELRSLLIVQGGSIPTPLVQAK